MNFKFLKNKTSILLFLILCMGLGFRLFAINWDNGYYFQPDERAIILAVNNLHLPQTLPLFLSPASPMNTHFFAYGNFPMYFLKVVSTFFSFLSPALGMYAGLYYIARPISAIFDTLTILLIFLLAKEFFSKKTALFSSFFYAASVLPIQLSHFFAVDTILTFFTSLTMLLLLRFYKRQTVANASLIGISLGFALATKISALALVPAVLCAISADFLLIILRQPHKPRIWFPHLPHFLLKLLKDFFVIGIFAGTFFVILQPYTIIDFNNFLSQNLAQAQMTRNAFTFPYTLQYVGKIPYWYEIENIFLYGLGPFIAFFSFVGFFIFFHLLFTKEKIASLHKELIFLSFFIVYFILVGKFAVGFMRYMLPLYPYFCIFAGVCASFLLSFLNRYKKIAGILTCGIALMYPLSFLSVYTKPNARVQASNWIYKHIPAKSSIAIEHWDDALPIYGAGSYRENVLELYNPDTLMKWDKIHFQLQDSTYIIIASNRLYVPLQKLTDCKKLPPLYCYVQTADYYKKLFDGSLGFRKIAEFESFPTIPFTSFTINDFSADESFTVYDHPKIMIFKKDSL